MSAPDRDQRTHAPTDKRLREFRERGEVARSRDLSTLGALLGGGGVLLARAESFGVEILSESRLVLGGLDRLDSAVALDRAAELFVRVISPVVGGALFGYVIASAPQLGFPPSITPLRFDPSRLASFAAAGSVMSPSAMAGRAGRAVLKLALAGTAVALAVSDEVALFAADPAVEPAPLLLRLFGGLGRLSLAAAFAIAIAAVVEYGAARRSLLGRLRMTSEEVRREHKEQEGDPHVRRRRRQRMRELAQGRLKAKVESSSVVVVNPTEYAVAIRYRPDVDAAPAVVAKGRHGRAERIRELARRAGIPIVSQPPLARWLFRKVPEGRAIPSALYRAVAEVLAYVHRIRRRRDGR